jgi:excisionase family DNA binding protein
MSSNQVIPLSAVVLQPIVTGIEYYVDADEAARFLKISRRTVLRWARERLLPAHPLTHGVRVTWRFKLSELDEWLGSGVGFLSTSRRPCHDGGIQ